jgi:hypothetical protein
MSRVNRLAVGAACALALAPAARGADELNDNLLGELTLGISNTNAVAGHGRLTAGFSADGDLTVLSWPGPSFADQLLYFTSNDPDARALPRFGALDGMGSRIGLLVTTPSGVTLTWLRDWPAAQGYSQPDAAVPVTTFTRADLGLTVTLTDVVSPDADVLSRAVRVQQAGSSPVSAVAMVVYENLSPTLSRVPFVPIADWGLPARADFVAAWDEDAKAVLHFHPGDRGVTRSLADLVAGAVTPDYGAADALMKQAAPAAADVAAFVGALDQGYPPGVAALVATDPPAAQVQVGTDATPYCALVATMIDNVVKLPDKFPGLQLPLDPTAAQLLRCSDPVPSLRQQRGWQWAPRDALADLGQGQAALSGSLIAAGQTNAALVVPLSFAAGEAQGSVHFAFGPTRAAARAALEAARALTPAARQAASEAAWHALLGAAPLPDPALGQRVRDVALRALVNIGVAREASSGAIVASLSRQPSYQLDWPRDGAFIDAALDLAGRGDWVEQRLRWYAGLLRQQPTAGDALLTPHAPTDPDTGQQLYPAGVFEMNYFGDGTPGGPIRFEIDDTALHLWTVAAHLGTRAPKDRGPLLAALWPSSKIALDVLTRWREPGGLPAAANEDDHADFTSTLHGAAAVHAALVAGERLANAQGDGASAARYRARRLELGAALLAAYFDPKSGLLRAERGTDPQAIGGPAGWTVWPGRLFARGDARLEPLLSAEMDRVLAALRGEGVGAGYLPKVVVAAALYGRDDGARGKAREAVLRLADMATHDTLQFGEVFEVKTAPDGTKSFVQRVAAPHVWEGALFYLSSMALTSPERFNPEEAALPLVQSGCGCTGANAGAPWFAGLLLLAWLRRPVRRGAALRARA